MTKMFEVADGPKWGCRSSETRARDFGPIPVRGALIVRCLKLSLTGSCWRNVSCLFFPLCLLIGREAFYECGLQQDIAALCKHHSLPAFQRREPSTCVDIKQKLGEEAGELEDACLNRRRLAKEVGRNIADWSSPADPMSRRGHAFRCNPV